MHQNASNGAFCFKIFCSGLNVSMLTASVTSDAKIIFFQPLSPEVLPYFRRSHDLFWTLSSKVYIIMMILLITLTKLNPKDILLCSPDILKTLGTLSDWRTGKHVKNPGFTGPQTVLQALIFFNTRFSIHIGQQGRHYEAFHGSFAAYSDPPLGARISAVTVMTKSAFHTHTTLQGF